MIDSTLTRLKVVVERAVRPVQASTSRKRRMREELLAHLCDIFEREFLLSGDEQAALAQAALRFGDPGEVSAQLQDSVPSRDVYMQLWEGRPDESVLWGALRFAGIESVIILVASAAMMFVAGWGSPWSRDELTSLVSSAVFLPFWLLSPLWLIGIAFFAHWMEKSLSGSELLEGWPRIGLARFLRSAWAVPIVRTSLIVGGSSVLALIGFGYADWPTSAVDWHEPALRPAAIPFAGMAGAISVVCAWFLVQTTVARRREHAQWARLPIE